MKKKLVVILEILIIFIAAIIYSIKIVIPEYKEKIGSSDKFIRVNDYVNMFEIKINNNIDFALLINEKREVYHIMFFSPNSNCLYNKNIEKNNFNNSLDSIIKILIENDYLKNDSTISIIRYENSYYNEFKNTFISTLNKYNLSNSIDESSNTINNKAKEINISSNDTQEMLREMDIYSKNLISSSNKKNKNISKLDDNISYQYSINVYKNIDLYIKKNNINKMELNNNDLLITLLPGDSEGKIFPSSNSWYYVEDGKVYAYIEFIDNEVKYGYCYEGNISLVSKGECK